MPARQEDTPSFTVAELVERFLAWLSEHRSHRTAYERSRHLKRFTVNHGSLKAASLTADHLSRFLNSLAAHGAAADWQAKHETSIRAMIHWGIKHGHLPAGFSPFATLEPIQTPVKALFESDLPTSEQVRQLLEVSVPCLADLLIVQHATGARTGELLKAKVGDHQPMTRQIVLRDHKRAKTMRAKAPRVILLNPRADSIVSRLCAGRPADEPIFRTPTGKPWTDELLSYHFRRARKRASIPDHITPYSLRHLWISEALMAGIDIMLVARMAGTSIAMVERVYGRFRLQNLAEAQARLDASRGR
jgi:integrase